MTGTVLIDSNILALLIVGSASPDYIAKHKNTRGVFDVDDLVLVTLLLRDFSEILLIPHVVAETSNLIRQTGEPRRSEIQNVFNRFVSQTYEVPVASLRGLMRDDSFYLGVTDSVLLYLCSLPLGEAPPTLLTNDGPLTDRAASLGYAVINYERDFKS